jgi:uncharacterized protein YuzE
MMLEYDPEVNALYLRFRPPKANQVVETVELEHFVNLDLDDAGEPVGIEFVSADDFLPFLRRHAQDARSLNLPEDLARLVTERSAAGSD